MAEVMVKEVRGSRKSRRSNKAAADEASVSLEHRRRQPVKSRVNPIETYNSAFNSLKMKLSMISFSDNTLVSS